MDRNPRRWAHTPNEENAPLTNRGQAYPACGRGRLIHRRVARLHPNRWGQYWMKNRGQNCAEINSHWYFRGERRQPASSGCSPVTGKFTAGVVGEELTATSQYVASSCYSRGNDPRGPGGRLQVHSRRRFNSIPMLRAIPVRSRNYLSSTLRDVNAWLLGE